MKGEVEDEGLGRGRAWQTVIQDEVKAKEAGRKQGRGGSMSVIMEAMKEMVNEGMNATEGASKVSQVNSQGEL